MINYQSPAAQTIPTHSLRRHQQEDVDLLHYLHFFIANWHWFALSLLICMGTAYMVNRHGKRIYRVTATALIEDKAGNSYGIGSSMFGGSNMTSGFGLYPSYYNLQNQILIMKSESLVSRTLQDLSFQVSYFRDEIWKRKEVLSQAPFIVVPDYSKSQPIGVDFLMIISGDGKMKVKSELAANSIELYNYGSRVMEEGSKSVNLDKEIRFGEPIEGEGYSFTLVPRNASVKNGRITPGNYVFRFNTYDMLLSQWGSALSLVSLDKDASLVGLTIETDCPEKAKLFLDKHLNMYLQRTLEKKNQVATNTIDFIDRQLVSIADSLDITGMSLQNYRRNNQVVDISFQSQQLYQQIKEFDNQRAALKIREDYFQYLLDYISRNLDSGDIVAPSGMGIEDASLNGLVLDLNRMADQKIAMVGTGTGTNSNPYIGTLESQIRNTTERLGENARNLLNNNHMALVDINTRLEALMREVKKLPQTERELLGIERKFKLNDNIYTYLLQRKAESQIAKASNTPDNEIIDKAAIKAMVKPKPLRNYGVGLGLGLIIPGLVLILISVVNNKITSEDDIKHISDLPVAGHITHSNTEYQTVVLNDTSNQVSETFRSLRTRLQFFTKDTQSPVILITSSMPSEGKTFASINLASAYSLVGKNTVLVGFDLRKPKIYDDFGITDDRGVSTYLIGRNTLDDIIHVSGYNNLSVIPSGPVPPNPAELAASARTVELFEELKKRFDHIIVDSAPLGAVSDSFALAAVADITVILVRHNKTIRPVLQNTLADAKANGVSGLCLLLNDISREKGIYGYAGRYRYGYYGYSYRTGK